MEAKELIDPKELRIGNLINFSGHPVTVWWSIDLKHGVHVIGDIPMGLVRYTDLLVDWINVKPIPITPEWLERLGFEKGNDEIGSVVYKNGKYWVYFLQDKFEVELYCGNNRVNLFRTWVYIHQLQNLFFALTGQELTIKQPEKA